VYRDETPISCHLVPQLGVGPYTVARTLNDVCAALVRAVSAQRQGMTQEMARKKLWGLLERCREEMGALEAARSRAEEAGELRAAGDAIYAHLHDIAPHSEVFLTSDGQRVALDPRRSPKENAAEYFRRYKKARSGLPRIAARLRTLRTNREYWEQLAWELERNDDARVAEGGMALLEEIAQAVGVKQPQPRSRRRAAQTERAISLTGGLVALVGRSPKDNERVTFSVASPNDLWLHARGIPGAHVVVRSAGQKLTQVQLEEAASLAAGHSRAAGDASVEVDYTARKHVRRRSGGRPGQVFYTEFKTMRVRPRHG